MKADSTTVTNNKPLFMIDFLYRKLT